MKATTDNTSHAVKISDDSDVLIKVEGVSKKFCRDLKTSLWYGVKDIARELVPGFGTSEKRTTLRPKEFWALNDISFELRRGECLGLIGRNGAGKTTLLKMLNGLIKPDKGIIEVRGRVGALIALGAGFNPILTGRENVYVNASVLGLSKEETDNKIEEIIEFAELGEFIDSPVQTYSSGMHVRLGFAVATAIEPDVLLLDEVLAVGDAAFRSKCFQRVGSLLEKSAVIFVSHDQVQVSRICDYCLYLKKEKKMELENTKDILARYSDDSSKLAHNETIVVHSCVNHFKVISSDTTVEWGGAYELTIELECSEKLISGLCLLTFLQGEVPVLETDFTQFLNDSINTYGRVALNIGPLHLRGGDYKIAVTILDETRKNTIVHAINCATVSLQGKKTCGVFYQASCTKG